MQNYDNTNINITFAIQSCLPMIFCTVGNVKGRVEYWSNLTLVTKTCTIMDKSNSNNFTMLEKF